MTTTRIPTLFAPAGGPNQSDDARWMGELRAWGRALPRPSAVLMFSAHWEEPQLTLGATASVPLEYDFGGFPERYYRLTYPAPPAPALADRVRALMKDAGRSVASAPDKGLDHGAYLPLMGLFPNADVPVLQASLPTLEPKALFELGRLLAPLRDEGVLIVGAGLLVHNLRMMFDVVRSAPGGWEGLATAELPVQPWVKDFDAWVADVTARRDWDALLDYRKRAPHVGLALPTDEHFSPLFVVAGAAEREPVTFPMSGFSYGVATRRGVQFGVMGSNSSVDSSTQRRAVAARRGRATSGVV